MKQKIQANIEGFLGKPVSLFGVIDTDTGVLNVVKAAVKRQAKRDDCVFISNTLKADCDFAFDETKFKDAIASYFRLKGGMAEDEMTPLLIISGKVGSADPKSALEMDGVSESGMDYRIAADISNMQMAVLAMCLYAEKSKVTGECLEMFDSLSTILAGGWLTV